MNAIRAVNDGEGIQGDWLPIALLYLQRDAVPEGRFWREIRKPD